MNTKEIGDWGEKIAEEFLQRCGYQTVCTGYRTRYGEIDIITRNDEYIVFVEVKLRKNGRFAQAREFVDAKKIERLRITADIWLSENETDLQPRFDVIEIYAPYGVNTRRPAVNHLEDAF